MAIAKLTDKEALTVKELEGMIGAKVDASDLDKMESSRGLSISIESLKQDIANLQQQEQNAIATQQQARGAILMCEELIKRLKNEDENG